MPVSTATEISDIDFSAFDPNAPATEGRTAEIIDPNSGSYAVRDEIPQEPEVDDTAEDQATVQQLSTKRVELPVVAPNVVQSSAALFVAGINDGVSKRMAPLNAAHQSMMAVLMSIEPMQYFCHVERRSGDKTGATNVIQIKDAHGQLSNISECEVDGHIELDGGVAMDIHGEACHTQFFLKGGLLWMAQKFIPRKPKNLDDPPQPSLYAGRPMKLRIRFNKNEAAEA